MSFDDRPISPGRMACKTGGWMCAFIGTRCNAAYPHCPNPNVNGKTDISTVSGVSRDIVSSVGPIYRVFRHIRDNGLKIVPNDCTLVNMQQQHFGADYQAYCRKAGCIRFETYMDQIFESVPENLLLLDDL